MGPTMSTPVAKLPKDLLIGEGLKDEILKEHNLKPTEATEKNVLPSAEDVKQEKTHQNILSGIAGFKSDSLKPTETKEKVVLPGEDDIKTEKTIQGVLQVRIQTLKEPGESGNHVTGSCWIRK